MCVGFGAWGAASPTAAMGQGRAPKGTAAETDMKKAKAKVAKVEKAQQVKAKVHTMKKVLSQPMATPEPEIVAMEEGEEEEHKDVDTEEEADDIKPNAKDYYHLNSKLARAPAAVQDAVSKIKALPPRSGNHAKLAQMAVAFVHSLDGAASYSRAWSPWSMPGHNRSSPRHSPGRSW